MDLTRKCDSNIVGEILARSQKNAIGVNDEMREMEQVEKVYASKVAFLEQLQKETFNVEDENEDIEQQFRSSDREQCKIIRTVIQPSLNAKRKMLNQLEEMEATEIETIGEFEAEIHNRTEAYLNMLKDNNREKQLLTQQEKMTEVRRLKAKSEELDSTIRELSSSFGILPKTMMSDQKPQFLARSPFGLKVAAIKNMTDVIQTINEVVAKIDSTLEPDLEERVDALEKQLMALQNPKNNQSSENYSDLIYS